MHGHDLEIRPARHRRWRRWSARSSPACSARRSAAPARTASTIARRRGLRSRCRRTCCGSWSGTARRVQRARLHLARQRRLHAAGRLPDRPPDRDDDGGGDLRVAVVHVYTIGYMPDDPGYQRFFSYISLFTFSMLMLVMSNNFLQLFFGWEAVGVVSYLLIGFWYTRPTRDLRQPQGVPGQPRRRLRLPARHRRRAVLARLARLRRRCSPTRRRIAGRHGRSVHRPRLVGCSTVDLHLPVHRRDGQVGAGAAARVAAGLDGRPDADLRADPRGDDGDRRHLHGGAHVAAVRAVARRR